MKRFALAVVLSVSITYLAAAQHHSEGGSTSSSSSSSGGGSSSGGYSGGSSGGSSGGYSGGTSHSSGSSGGGGYSGGGSSHSSGSSGGYSGGSHSSGGAGYSGGGSSHSGGSHSNAGSSHSSDASGSGAHSSSGNGSARSNVRSSANSAEHGGSSSGALQAGGAAADKFSTLRQATTPTEPWMHKSLTLDISAANLNKALTHHEFDSKLQAQGLETNKASYREKLAALGMTPVHRPNWIARMFGSKTIAPKHDASPQLRPCLIKECKPVPVPPKPCVGPKCPVPPPTAVPTPSTGVCTNGYDAYGYCAPWGYVDRCSTQSNYCYVRFAHVNSNYCGRILQEIRREQATYRQVEQMQQSYCTAGPQSQECAQATQKLVKWGNHISQLQHQYQICQAASGGTAVDPSLTSDPTAPPDPQSTGWPFFSPRFF